MFNQVNAELFVVDKILYGSDDKLGENEADGSPKGNSAENIRAHKGDRLGGLDIFNHRSKGVCVRLNDSGVVAPSADICH